MSQAQEIIVKLNQLSAEQRAAAFSAILNCFCVGCGGSGDFSRVPCSCEPMNPVQETFRAQEQREAIIDQAAE